jgi:hypothetical protein
MKYSDLADAVLKTARKVPRGSLRAYAMGLLKTKQSGACAVCGKPISLTVMGAKSDYVVDHCHTTGLIRGVLHRSCNASLGKLDNAVGRWGAKSMSYDDIIPFLEKVILYYKSGFEPTIYPDHKTAEEKAAITKQKATRAAAVRKARLKIRAQENA